MITEGLSGRRIAVTGATGFLGTAIVERLLRSVPDCEVVLLVRAGRRSTPAQRVHREVVRNDAFDRMRTERGDGFAEEIARRLHVVTGDVGRDGLGLDDEGRAALATCDIVIHSAASVAFDSPLDSAVEVNLLGPSRVTAALRDVGSRAHLVAVSTCYVAGNRRGPAPEERVDASPFFPHIDWRTEVTAARRTRTDTEAASRRPGELERFRSGARAELGAAGTPLLAARAEKLRQAWVHDELVEAGRARAASLGWPDAYAYTKALGEQALLESRGEVPVSIVRPSIIESALAEPFPGWIRGFRMAEPIIISYARGFLKEFPGVPEGIVDVIPVDLVVAAVLAAAAAGPPAEPVVYQVASGSVNPLRYRRMVESIQGWFSANPLYDPTGQPIVVAEWSFNGRGRGRVQGQLQRAVSTLTTAERTLQKLPLRGEQARWSARLEERRTEAERALGYVQLYGAYAESEAVFQVDRLLALWDAVPPAERAMFGFDPRVVDWNHYITGVHLPSVVQHARVRTTPGRRVGQDRSTRLRAQVLHPSRHIAAFDLENTLIASNVVESFSWLATRRLAPADRLRFALKTIAEGPKLLALDRKDRGDFLRYFYRRYEGASVASLDVDAVELLSGLLLAKSFPAAIRRVRRHRELGHRTLLITGALDVVVAPLRPLFDEIICASMSRTPEGRYTGELEQTPPTGEARALLMAGYAAAEDLRLEESVAYADSASDLPMLEAVGFPVAVNPETRLAALARKRGWLVEQWERAPGGPLQLLPIGPLTRRSSFPLARRA